VDQLTTPRLLLRRWSGDDRAGLSGLASDPRVVRYIGDGSVWTAARVDDFFERQLRHWEEHGFGWRALVVAGTGRWIGFVGLNHVPPEAVEITTPEVEIGWWLEPGHWGQGLATEGALALRDEAFGRVGLDRIIGRYQPPNAASGRIMEKLGMTFERDATGRHGDTVRICGLDRATWARLSGA
jgi:RimJ/RimL family protein N-acetyltransferase